MGVRARRFDAVPPAGPTQTTRITWGVDSTFTATAGGLANNELTFNQGLLDARADNDATITTANGPVSAWASGQGITGSVTQGSAALQPAHVAASNWVQLTAASQSDLATGDFLSLPDPVRDRYRTTTNALGIVYLLVQVGTLPTWQSTLVRIGANSSTYPNFFQRSYRLYTGTTGTIAISRGGNGSGDERTAPIGGVITPNQWVAIGWVLNDSRLAGTVNGAPDQLSRLFVKTLPGGNAPSMQAAATAAMSVVADATYIADLGRSRWNNFTSADHYFNGLRVHSLGFDAQPPITDAAIENNLDRLLARVAP
jgi:hypothetical protein